MRDRKPAGHLPRSEQRRLHVDPRWNALQEHHSEITPSLAERVPKRELADAWRLRRGKYERWLTDPETFFVIAEEEGRPIGYAFVTVGPGYASWATGQRLAELETLSVLPEHRGGGVGETGGVHVERAPAKLTLSLRPPARRPRPKWQGFAKSFVVYYGKRS